MEAFVQGLEGLDRQVHLAPDLDHRGWIVDRQPMRHALDRPDVGGDVLADAAVAARGRAGEPAVLIRQGARDPVDLELAHEPVGRATEAARHAIAPGVQLVKREGVVERQHRRAMLHRREQRRHRGLPDALRRRVRRDQLGERVLEPAELEDELVVLGVADLGVVQDVIAVGVVVDEFAELLNPNLRLRPLAIVAHPAISTPPATPMRSPTTTTAPITPGTFRR